MTLAPPTYNQPNFKRKFVSTISATHFPTETWTNEQRGLLPGQADPWLSHPHGRSDATDRIPMVMRRIELFKNRPEIAISSPTKI
jgi:hypothetical protein